jgi:hypothetical protein
MTYTDEDFVDFIAYLNVDYIPRMPLSGGDAKLRYYIGDSLAPYGLTNEALHILFVELLENMPLHINDTVEIGFGSICLSKIAAWRLSRAK